MDTAPQFGLGILATFASASIIPFLHIALLRFFARPDKTVPWSLGCFALSFVLWHVWFFAFKEAQSPALPVMVSGLATLGFLWLGYLEMMFKLYRGFSHTLVEDIHRLGRATVEDVLTGFASGMGMQEMLERRLRTMHEAGLIDVRGQTLTVTGKGKRLGMRTLRFKTFLRLGRGG